MVSDNKKDTIRKGGIAGMWDNLSRNNPNFSSLASTTIIFVVMVLVLSILAPRFLSARNVTNILTQSAAYLIMAVGMTFVLTTGGIDISLGSMIGLTTAVLGRFVVEQGGSWILGVALALVFGLILGLWNGLFVVKFTVPSIIVTLGSMTMFRGMAYSYIEGQIFYGYPEAFLFLARGRIFGIPMAVYIAFAVFLLGLYVMDHTKLGRHITALGGNEEAARLAGIPVKLLRLLVFANMGLLTGLATVILTARLGSSEATAGMGMEIHVIAAVVLGGTMLSGGRGLMFGTLLGVLILAVLENGLLLAGVSFFMQRVLLGLIFILVVAARSMRDKSITTAT
jgi:ribose/xylose/arabinose/galactoside ABC-type transport system permease subunit